MFKCSKVIEITTLNTLVVEKERYMDARRQLCVGQNKNNIVMAYLVWRVIQNKCDKIKLSFLPVRHTMFGVDLAFGLFKQYFRKSKASNLAEVADIVRESTPRSKLNKAVITGSQSGQMFVPIYD